MQKITLTFLSLFILHGTYSQSNLSIGKLKTRELDKYMTQVLKDWNTPGSCIGIVVKNKLVYAKGYGYRDYEKKLPVTPATLYQIASNTKLFTASAIGMLVEEGKLDWDKPIRTYVPSIEFYNEDLNNSVTIHDMLSHRTGVSRHDMIWFKSDFTRKELFNKLKYLEPSLPLRQGFLYNNLMYAASGYVIELLTKKKWEDFIKERLLVPLGMANTVFNIEDMKKQADYGIPYNEKRDTNLLYKIPFYEETGGLGPAGSMISNITDMSHWLIALMNDGKYEGKQVIPSSAVKATLEPSVALPNNSLQKGYHELVNPVYGMGRETVAYRGHRLVSHGGDLPGFHSQISYMPEDSIGVVVFVIGDQGQPLYDIITYNVFERLQGLDLTPWSERKLKDNIEGKKVSREARSKAGGIKVAGTKPSHALEDYVGQFENNGYGFINISKKDSALQFNLHKISLPLNHYHYDRFDTPNDEEFGLYSVNFYNNPQGDIDKLVISLDEGEAIFMRRPDSAMSNPAILQMYTGKYEIAGFDIEVVIRNGNELTITAPGSPNLQLLPYKRGIFHTKEFADMTMEFTIENGKVTKMKQRDPSGEYEFKKK